MVEANLNRLRTVVGDRDRLGTLSDVSGARGQTQRARRQLGSDWRVLAHDDADALDDLEELVLRDRDRMFDALRTKRGEVGELPLNAADAEPEPIDAEGDQALTDCHAEWARRGAREPHDFFHRLNGDDCLERLGWSFGERCFCNSQAIRIGSRHDQAILLEANESARQNGTAFIARRCALYAAYDFGEG